MTTARLNVLVIEDDPEAQANLCDVLELDGHQVTAACSVGQALNRENWHEISAIILDRRLPDGSGDQLLPRLRQLSPSAAIIVVTGNVDWEGTVTALRHGATDYILKPIDPDALRATLARVVRLKQAEERALQAERLAAIGEMITAISHESRNAMQRLSASMDELTDELRDRPDVSPLLGRMRRAQYHLQRFFEELRNFGAPIHLDRTICHVASSWRQAWADLESSRRGRDAVLTEKISGVDVHCSIDLFRMGQVFRNLFENSLAACHDPVRIEIECSEADIDDLPFLRIKVRDNGPGLNKEQRQRVFEPFYTTKPKGTGLGMAIVKRFVQAHGGDVAVGNSSRAGAEFVLTLPRTSSD